MKKTASLLLILSLLLTLCALPASAEGTVLTGEWREEIVHNIEPAGMNKAFYLDGTVTGCREVLLTVSIAEFTGAPFGNWYLFAKDLGGYWHSVADFKLKKSMSDGHTEGYSLRLDNEESFTALALRMRDKGNEYSIVWGDVGFVITSGEFTPAEGAAPAVGTKLEGTWAPREEIGGQGHYTPYVLNEPADCSALQMKLSVSDIQGDPYGTWALWRRTRDGTWHRLSDFTLSESMGDGHSEVFTFTFPQTFNFDALVICIDDPSQLFNLRWDLEFYI